MKTAIIAFSLGMVIVSYYAMFGSPKGKGNSSAVRSPVQPMERDVNANTVLASIEDIDM